MEVILFPRSCFLFHSFRFRQFLFFLSIDIVSFHSVVDFSTFVLFLLRRLFKSFIRQRNGKLAQNYDAIRTHVPFCLHFEWNRCFQLLSWSDFQCDFVTHCWYLWRYHRMPAVANEIDFILNSRLTLNFLENCIFGSIAMNIHATTNVFCCWIIHEWFKRHE